MAAKLSMVLLLVAGFISCSFGFPTISSVGSKFFTSDGQQFFVKGIAYQLTQDDPLLDEAQCNRDATLMQTLGTNSIRVYHVDPTQDHTACMSVFEAAGIYLWLDLDTFTSEITQISPQWDTTNFGAFAAVMDSFQSFDNMAGFWLGNEVITSTGGSGAAPYIKAAASDMKAYRKSKGYREIPIGYSAADIAELRPMLQNYLACGDEATSIEFFGLNSYEWCGDANYMTSGYSNLQTMSANYSIPIFFSETGCNTVPPRTFTDQSAIFGPDMINTWSGSIIYEWIQEANSYGLITYGSLDVKSGTPTAIEPDFGNLKAQWQSINPTGISKADYSPSLAAPACPSSTSGGWLIDGNPPLPTLVVGGVIPSFTPSVTSTTPLSTSASTSPLSTSASSVLPKSTGGSTTNTASSTASAGAATTTAKQSDASRTGLHLFLLVSLVLSAFW